ncbi:CoA-acylating methylmalonate-semialdehyde dehydrogenase (plasmid) [Vibrio chagasii]|uniref:CoA-acylating methylmalonate-semialdehyde dehydrogenase n=1 Tax=Vibrio chagasii TaxID=170679 RepID=UPI003DA8C53F
MQNTTTQAKTILGQFINGVTVVGDGVQQPIMNPSTGKSTKSVELASTQTVNEAVQAAHEAYLTWSKVPPAKRARVLFNFKALVEANRGVLAELIGQEHGKISHDAQGEIQRGIENIEYACGAPEVLKGEYSKDVGPAIDSWSDFQPLGVVAGITPFNFPAMVPLWMFPIAIACGNSFILKPSEKVPSASLFMADLLKQAGLPDGVFTVLNGGKDVVDQLIQHKLIKATSFVGSTPIAEYIYQESAKHGKRCQALGGAKNHAIVLSDADVDNAVSQLIGAAFGSSGERCMALSVVVAVGDAVANQLIDKLKDAMSDLKVGEYSNDENHFGPVISKEHKEKINNYIQSAEGEGATIVVDGRNVAVENHEDGYYVGGTLIDNVQTDMLSYQDEIFGPVLQVLRVETMQQAIELINNHKYGNGTCIFTRDGEAARYFTDNIEVGMVGINVPLPVPVSSQSFGGWKSSLFGDLAMYGPDGFRFFTRRKTVTQRWPSSNVRENIKFSMPTL